MKEHVLKEKSMLFAIRIVNLYKFLGGEFKEYVMSKQILRSGTAVGAMVREAEHSESFPDFIHKLSIAQKEINETLYWLELLRNTSYITQNEFNSMNEDAVEILKIITASLKTVKQNYSNKRKTKND